VVGVLQAESAPLPIAEVTASSDDGNVPANTRDGDLGTRWSASGDGQWIRYELNGCDTVTQVSIAWHKGDSRISTFDIEVSDDGTAWTQVHSGTSSGTTLDLEPVDIDDVGACFVRIVGHGNDHSRQKTSEWNSITEVVIEGPADPDPEPIPVLAVSASSDDGNVPGNTLDMDLNTRWSALGDGQWIEFDLGEPAPTFNRVHIAWYQGNTRSSTFDIETSDNGEDWTLRYGGYSSGTTLELQPYAFADATARYVRIVGFGNSSNDWNSITEVEFMHVD
jgi:hypothetical protein